MLRERKKYACLRNMGQYYGLGNLASVTVVRSLISQQGALLRVHAEQIETFALRLIVFSLFKNSLGVTNGEWACFRR